MKILGRTLSALALGVAVFAASAPLASPASAAPQTINVTIDCAHAVSVTADVGDTIVFKMTHPGCNGAAYGHALGGNFANLDNLNGTYFAGIGSGFEGTATGSGFLDYVSHTQGTFTDTDYWHDHGGQDDWYVMQTDSTESTSAVEITTTLRSTDGNGASLGVGATIADIYTQPDGTTPVEYAVTYAGPRSDTSSSALASTGRSTSNELLLVGGAAVLLLVGGVLLALLRRRSYSR